MLPSGSLLPDIERIAVLRANALGDLVVALPALEALRAAYPRAHIALLGRDHHRALLAGRPSPVDEVVVLPEGAVGDERTPMEPAARDRLLRDLAARSWDLAVQLHGGGRNSNGFVNALRARVTAGSRTPDAPQLDRSIPYEHYQWEVARWLEVVGLVGAAPVAIEPVLPVTDGDRAALDAALPGLASRPYAVLHPGATDPRRRWPAPRFADVACDLASLGRAIVVTGVPAEADLVGTIVERLRADGRDAIAALRLELPALVALLAGADVVVSNDTGPLHVAIAAGAPTVGIFWIGNLINAGPFTRARHRPLTSWRLACPVCGVDASTGRCEHDVSFVADVPAHAAREAARSLLGVAA